jgi:glycosyltransferase involved in cell wall biosynthesis
MVDVTYIIPALNAQKTIAKCLSAILSDNSSIKSEIIVVDNGSTDKTQEQLAKFSHQIKILHCSAKGAAKARNLGASHARGQWLAFIDSDVLITPSWTESMLSFTTDPTVAIIQGPIYPLDEKWWHDYRTIRARLRTNGSFNHLESSLLNIIPVCNTAACFIKKSLFLGFDEQLMRSEDMELTIRTRHFGYTLASNSQAHAKVLWDRSLFAYFQRFYLQGQSTRKVWEAFGIHTKNISDIFKLKSPGIETCGLIWNFFDFITSFLYSKGWNQVKPNPSTILALTKPCASNFIFPILHYKNKRYTLHPLSRRGIKDSKDFIIRPDIGKSFIWGSDYPPECFATEI